MSWHEEMRQAWLVGRCCLRRLKCLPFTNDLVGSKERQEIELSIPRPAGTVIRQIDDISLALPFDRRMGRIDEAP